MPLSDSFIKRVSVNHLARLIAESRSGVYLSPEELQAAADALPKEGMGRLYDLYARQCREMPTKNRFVGWILSESEKLSGRAELPAI